MNIAKNTKQEQGKGKKDKDEKKQKKKKNKGGDKPEGQKAEAK